MRAVVKGIAGVAGIGVAAFAGTSAVDDNTTRNDQGTIVESGGLGAFQIRVGDCFNDPDPDAEYVASVEGVPCSVPHDAEVFAEFDAPNATFPGEDELFEQSWWDCLARFEGYVGLAYENSVLDVSAFTQTEAGWDAGEREISCIVFDSRGNKLTASTRGARF